MGADLLLLTLDWKPKGPKETPEKGFRRTCDGMDKKIDKVKKMPDENDLCDISGGTWSGKPPTDEDSGEEVTLDVYKQHLYDLVDELRGCWNCRTVVWFKAGDRWVFATGGMSWGEAPSEVYELLSKLYSAGVV